MNTVQSTRKKQIGFTLIELMVVVIILGLLATVVLTNVIGREEEARITTAKTQIRSLENALGGFKLDNGFYPATEQGLDALIHKPDSGRVPRKWKEGGYLRPARIPKDPWGNNYLYFSPGNEGRPYEIISYGPDEAQGGEGKNADIESWTME